jgi:hypothetical protein
MLFFTRHIISQSKCFAKEVERIDDDWRAITYYPNSPFMILASFTKVPQLPSELLVWDCTHRGLRLSAAS